MATALVWAVFLSFAPGLLYAAIVYWLDHFEKEPKVLLGGVFLWGAVVATTGAIVVNSTLQGGVRALTGSVAVSEAVGASVLAPLVEEALKGLAVFVVFLAFRKEFDSVLDGIVYGAIVGLGFAATENVLYLLGAFRENGMEGLLGLFVLRVLLGAWNHALYTSLTGIGLAVARMSPSLGVRLVASVAGLAAAMGAHAFHNGLAVASDALLAEPGVGLLFILLTDWTGWIAMLVVILFTIRHEGRLIDRHLAEEAALGLLTPAQHGAAGSLFRRNTTRIAALFSGRYSDTCRLQHACAELAHKKHQWTRLGDPGDGGAEIHRLRTEIAALAPTAQP